MASSIPGSLSNPDEAIVRKLFKVICATKYADPVDQDTFLVDFANTVLKFRPQVASFAQVGNLAECVFTSRSMMHTNGARLGTPFSDAFVSIQDFAGKIIRKRQVFRDRQRANSDRLRVAEGMAARVQRHIALEHALNAGVKGSKPPSSPNEDTVSIPSSSDESDPDEVPRTPKDSSPSPIWVDPANVQPSSQAVPLSPLSELDVRLGRLMLGTAHHTLPSSPLSPDQFLPDLVPDFTLGQHRLPVKGSGWKRGRTAERTEVHKPRAFLTRAPVVQCNSLRLIRLPFGPPGPFPKPNFVGDWLQSKRKFEGSHVPRKNYSGSSRPSANPNRAFKHRPVHRKVKRCYHCSAPDHLVALCPMRETID
ncbi:hypothetical protein DFH09DRAFT_1339524 [Mycena vulgaris]|nr:hypothetical protein DFH09DRAFT_1339524 [Mycena vulgaris]